MANQQSIIVVKKGKKVRHGAHGGAWKIAYADFVTAMMAFFLLLWLLNSVTQEALEGISNYFAPVSVSASDSGSGGVLGGQSLSVDGAGTSSSTPLSQTLDLAPPRAGSGGDSLESAEEVTEREAREKLQAVEQAQFEEAQKAISDAIEESPELKKLADSLQIDNTPDGLRIQLLDMDNFAMFHSGGSEMLPQTRELIAMVSKIILTLPQDLAISGHTDSVPFVTSTGYGNWELSADRANSARRELVFNHIPEDRIAQVVGKAATDPFLPEDPTNASNRRLSIVLLKGTGEPVAVPEDAEEKEAKEDPETKSAISNGKTINGLKKPSQKSETDFLTKEPEVEEPDEPEFTLPGLDKIKQKQLKTSQ